MDVDDIPQALVCSECVPHLVFKLDIASGQFRSKPCPDFEVVVGCEHAEYTTQSRVALGVYWVRFLPRLGDDLEDLFGSEVMDG